MENLDQLKKTVSRWESAHFIVSALLEDYAEQMSKSTGTPKEIIKQRVMTKARSLADKQKKQTLEQITLTKKDGI